MTQRNKLTIQPINAPSVGKWALVGAGIALVLISIFLLGVNEPDPNWPKLWMGKPLVIVPLAGAVGGVCFYVVTHLPDQQGWKKVFATVTGLFIYLIGLWLGIVLGLDGTLWD